MSREYVQIRAEVVTCTMAMTLKPGDRLLVLDGRVVSIYTGNMTPTDVPTPDDRPKPLTNKKKPSKKGVPPPKPYKDKMEIAGLLREHLTKFTDQWHDAKALREALQLPADHHWGHMFREAIKVLKDNGEIQRRGSTGSTQYTAVTTTDMPREFVRG